MWVFVCVCMYWEIPQLCKQVMCREDQECNEDSYNSRYRSHLTESLIDSWIGTIRANPVTAAMERLCSRLQDSLLRRSTNVKITSMTGTMTECVCTL